MLQSIHLRIMAVRIQKTKKHFYYSTTFSQTFISYSVQHMYMIWVFWHLYHQEKNVADQNCDGMSLTILTDESQAVDNSPLCYSSPTSNSTYLPFLKIRLWHLCHLRSKRFKWIKCHFMSQWCFPFISPHKQCTCKQSLHWFHPTYNGNSYSRV